ncbi:heavy metal translocating P-type ATPase [Thalassolituus sp. UBA2590]|uniref:heavy metal translocating P-type ATPase n=1 Tax=Thalassolituus sp. UBA2590 TaxID=1947663 RepID=UPI002647EF4C|nr:heavy metal translocating P-type ATPase [Thalassolituus sp. UBA2590]
MTQSLRTPCFHCGEPLKAGQQWTAIIDGKEEPMCCPGCKAVAETIVASGLKDYYRHRTELPQISPANEDDEVLTARESLSLYDSEALQKQFVATQGEQKEATLIIDGISCAACAWLIEHRVNQLKGVERATLNLSNHRLVVAWNNTDIALSQIFEAIYRLGYKAAPFSSTEDDAQREREGKKAIRRLAVAGIGMMQVMMLAVPLYAGMAEQYEVFMRFASMILTLPVVLYSARPFFDAAIRDLKTRHLTMDVPVSLAIILAFCASIWSTFNQGVEVYFDSVCMFTFLLLLGRFLEMRARHRMGKAGNNLMTLLPNVALKQTQDGEEIIAAGDISTGDRLLLKPGYPVPADGVVVEGQSTVDESALTGEYMPLNKQAGDTLIGGTMNVESPLIMEVTATGADAQLSTIVRLMDRAQQEKPKVALIADSIASRFVAAVLIISASVFSYWMFQGNDHAFFIALSVLVVTCPCALSLATPTTLTAATTALRERGLLISKGHVLETLQSVNRVVFDKTGTLTLGHLTLTEVRPVAGGIENSLELDQDTLASVVASLEQHASHPIAKAFRHYPVLATEDIQHHPSQGVSGQVNGYRFRFGRPDFVWPEGILPPDSASGQWLLLADDKQPLAWFLLNDTVRRSAGPLIETLKTRGIEVALLTGDPSRSATLVADELGISDVRNGLSPEDKLAIVREWQKQGDTVLMVGDGINDVPVLAGADVSLAVNEATDLAKTNADTLLTNGRLEVIADALSVSHKTRNVIRQNIGWALLYNLIALPLAAAGMVPPWAAAIGMSFSSLLVVLNALRLTRRPPALTAES